MVRGLHCYLGYAHVRTRTVAFTHALLYTPRTRTCIYALRLRTPFLPFCSLPWTLRLHYGSTVGSPVTFTAFGFRSTHGSHTVPLVRLLCTHTHLPHTRLHTFFLSLHTVTYVPHTMGYGLPVAVGWLVTVTRLVVGLFLLLPHVYRLLVYTRCCRVYGYRLLRTRLRSTVPGLRHARFTLVG